MCTLFSTFEIIKWVKILDVWISSVTLSVALLSRCIPSGVVSNLGIHLYADNNIGGDLLLEQ